MPILLSILKKIGPWLMCLVLGIGLGVYGTKRWLVPATGSKTEKVDKSATSKEQTKRVIVIKHPDGTVETTNETINRTDKTKEVANTKEKTVPVAKSKVKTGILVKTSTRNLMDSKGFDYGMSLDVRLLGPVWLDTSYYQNSKELTLGLSWEF